MTMFYAASSFNQPLGNWSVDSVTTMSSMLKSALAFDQDLGWCLDDDVDLNTAFTDTKCELWSGYVLQKEGKNNCSAFDGVHHTDESIRKAVAAWLSNATAAEATYGHISTWETGGVTYMGCLFGVRRDWMDGQSWADHCVLSTASFNEDISAWNTSNVRWMHAMFLGQELFNRPLGGWTVDKVL